MISATPPSESICPRSASDAASGSTTTFPPARLKKCELKNTFRSGCHTDQVKTSGIARGCMLVLLDGVVDGGEELVRFEGFRDASRTDALDLVVEIRLRVARGDEEEGHVGERRIRAQLAAERHAVTPGHEHVGDDDVGPLTARQDERVVAVGRFVDVVTGELEVLPKRAAEHRLVVDEKDTRHQALAAAVPAALAPGISTDTVVPCPTSLEIEMAPPMRSTRRATIARPRPVPRISVPGRSTR